MLTRRVSMRAIFGLLPVKLIHQVCDVAHEVHYHAEQLHYVNGATRISKRTQHQHLDQIKSQVNEGLRPALKRLTEIQPQLPARHLVIIDQMLASAKALAADAKSAIRVQNSDGVVNNGYVELIININKHDRAERALALAAPS